MEPKKRILALDLGTKTGWAFREPDGQIISGTEGFGVSRYSGGGMRFLKFHRWLEQNACDCEAVYFEEVRRHLGVDAAHVYGGFLAHLTSFCEAQGIAYEGVPVQTIKKSATGKGNASKEDMLDAAIVRGHQPVDDNEADALLLLYFIIERDA